MTGSAAKGAAAAHLNVAPDLAERLAKWHRVRMPFDGKRLSARDVKMVNKLVDASRYLEDIFWRQSDPDGLNLYLSLANSKDPKDQQLRNFLRINGSRYDLLADNSEITSAIFSTLVKRFRKLVEQ